VHRGARDLLPGLLQFTELLLHFHQSPLLARREFDFLFLPERLAWLRLAWVFLAFSFRLLLVLELRLVLLAVVVPTRIFLTIEYVKLDRYTFLGVLDEL